MEDYLSEKEKWEWVKAQVRENALAVILAVVLAVGAVSGWRWWQGHLDAGRLEAGAKYMQMVHALERGGRSRAREDRPQHGVRQGRVHGQPEARRAQDELGDDQDPAAVVGVDDGTAPQRTEQQGSQLDQAHQTDDEA